MNEDLAFLAPDIEEFMKAFMLDIKDVDSIMRLCIDVGSSCFSSPSHDLS